MSTEVGEEVFFVDTVMPAGRPGGLPFECTCSSELDGGMGWVSAGSRDLLKYMV